MARVTVKRAGAQIPVMHSGGVRSDEILQHFIQHISGSPRTHKFPGNDFSMNLEKSTQMWQFSGWEDNVGLARQSGLQDCVCCVASIARGRRRQLHMPHLPTAITLEVRPVFRRPAGQTAQFLCPAVAQKGTFFASLSPYFKAQPTVPTAPLMPATGHLAKSNSRDRCPSVTGKDLAVQITQNSPALFNFPCGFLPMPTRHKPTTHAKQSKSLLQIIGCGVVVGGSPHTMLCFSCGKQSA